MTTFEKVNLLLMLDREFDQVIAKISDKNQQLNNALTFRDKAKYAAEAVELEDYAVTLFNIAQQILEG